MKGSPAIWSEKRVHRAQEMQRSRSSSTWVDSAIGLGNVRFGTSKRDSPRPLDIAWFCSGHSPPLSQTGQSSGWLMSSSSMTPCWASSATSDVSWVRTTMPSVTVVVQEASGLQLALDLDQALPAGAGRVEERVVAEARDRDAELLGGADHERALGHGHAMPSMVTRDEVVPLLGGRAARGRRRGDGHQACAPVEDRRGDRVEERRSRRVHALQELVLEVLDARTVIGHVAPSPSAQKERPMMLSHDCRERSRSACEPLPCSKRRRSSTSQ